MQLRDEGEVGAIGLAGGRVQEIAKYLDLGVFDVLLVHNRWTLVDRSAGPLLEEAVRQGMGILNAAVYGGGILAFQAGGPTSYGYRPAPPETLQAIEAMRRVCSDFHTDLGTAALQFSLRDERIASTVVGMSRPGRVARTLDLASEPLPDALWPALEALRPAVARLARRMSRVVVTGGSGKLGRAVVEDLATHGYDVVNVDTALPPAGQKAVFSRVDLTDLGEVTEALTGIDDRYDGVDAVVHLAAIPAPGLRPSGATFANNVVATHHVFSAARRAGITNVVWASSETVLGLPFETPPPYVPVDEEYAVRPESTYSLGKAVEEEMARHFTRWDPTLKLIGLRFSNVMERRRLRRVPVVRRRPPQPHLEPLGLHRRPRRRPGGPARARERPHRVRGVHRRVPRHRAGAAVRRARRGVLPRRPGAPPDRGPRDAAVHRQGPPPARLRPAAHLARRGVTVL